MMQAHRWGIVCLISCMPFNPGLADEVRDKARQLLQKAVSSARMLNYEGTFVYSHGRSIDTLHVVHRYGEAGEYERLTSLTGRPSEITRSKGHVHYRFADREAYGAYKVEDKTQQFVGHLAARYEDLSQLYEFHPFEGARVAGRQTQGFLIQPKDHFRYGYQLWLDAESGLVLKSQLLSDEGPVETLMFTQIRYDAEGVSDVPLAQMKTAPLPRVSVSSRTQWRPQWMPRGFQLTRATQRTSTSSGIVSHRMVLSDGISMVSIFIEPVDMYARRGHAYTRKGATTGYTTVAGDHRITAVGEVPVQTIQRIAQSLTIH